MAARDLSRGSAASEKSRSGGCIRRTVRKQRVGRFLANGIYDYVHYHATVHEVLGVARGNAVVRFGGDTGTEVAIAAGDVAILPAGTGHQCLSASRDFCVVGAYPPGPGMHVTLPTPENHAKALQTIPQVKMPGTDPVRGPDGPLVKLWKASI